MNVNHLGWWIAGIIVAGDAASCIWTWFGNRYEVTMARPNRRRPFRPRVMRRWYAPGDHVILKHGGRSAEKPDRWLVIGWDSEAVEVPWLLVQNLDFAGYADLGPARPRWAPVTDFAPYTVRKLRPWVDRDGRFPVPHLRDYLPARSPSGHLKDVRDVA